MSPVNDMMNVEAGVAGGDSGGGGTPDNVAGGSNAAGSS